MTERDVITLSGVSKRFVLHPQGGTVIEAVQGVRFAVAAGECVALTGPSGSGKSTILRMIFGNYRVDRGSIRVCGQEVAGADPRTILALRRDRLGYVSQFLRVVPRVPTLDIVAEPLLARGVGERVARDRAAALLTRLRIPERLWGLGPATFSGGEQQRVNLARGFVADWPALLVDEPTASLDAENRATVLGLIEEARARGTALVGIFHDAAARAQVCTRGVDVTAFAPAPVLGPA